MDKNIIVCNMRYQNLCTLYDNSQVSAYDISITEALNEIVELTFKYPIDDVSQKYVYLTPENLVLYNKEYYRIKTIEPSHDDDGKKYIDVTCRHISESLQYTTISLEEQTPKHIDGLMESALLYEDGEPTIGWQVGNIEVDKTIYRGLEATEESVFTILTTIAEKYDGILKFNSVDKTVDMLKMADEDASKFDIRISKDLKDVKITYDTTELITRLYCFGASDDNGNELDIMDVNPTGKAYIDNFDYYLNLGYTEDDIKNSPELFLKTNVWRDGDYYDKQDLYDTGVKKLADMSIPTIEVSISALDMSQYGNYRTTSLNIGDAVNVYDADLGAEFVCNVTSISKSSSDSHLLNIEVTNKIQYKNIIERLFSTIGTTNTVISNSGKVNGSKVTNITTNQISDIDNYVDNDTAQSTYVTNDTLTNNYLTSDDISNSYATIEDINGSEIKVNADLNKIVDILTGKAENEDLEIQRFAVHEIEADIGTFKDLTTENFTATNATIDNLKVTKAEITDLEASNLRIENVETNKANITDLNATNANIETLTTTKANVTDLEATNANVTSLQADKANVTDLNATNATVQNLSTTKANITDLNVTNENVANLQASKASVDDLTATNASITSLDAKKANVTDLNVTNENVTNLNASKANVVDLNSANANIGTLQTKVGEIDTLLAGNLSSSNIQSGGITSDRLNVSDGFITNAMINSLDAGKINTGEINTTDVTISSDSGNLQISDNTIQINDANTTRVQIGKDASNDYSMYVWDASGNLMFDALGIHEDAIKSGIIRNSMVAIDAAISGSKLDIESVITSVNGATSNINSSKVNLSTENQTLDVAFSALKNTVSDVSDATSTNTTNLEVANGKIYTLIDNTTITKDGETTQLKDAYNRTVQDVSSISTQLNSQQTTLDTATGDITEMKAKQSSFDQSLNGFSTTVSEVSVTTANTAKNSIISMEDEYYKSTSNTTLTGGSWLSTSLIRDEGTYIWKRTLITHGDNSTEYSDPICITGDVGKDGENAIVLRIDSSRGNMFKNSSVNTVLTVSISNGSQKIIDYAGLTSAFGSSAYLEWSWKRINDASFSTISLSDSRIKDNGFTFELSSEDVDTKVVFECNLNI